MKKLLAMFLVVMMLSSLAVTVSADRPNEEVEVLKFVTAPKIDGVITEAEWGKPTVRVYEDQATTEYVPYREVKEPEENLWFDLWIRWDEDYYYVGVNAPDTVHALTASENSLWNGDVVQMGFDPMGVNPADDLQFPWSDDYTNMAFGLVSAEGGMLSSWAWYGPCEAGPVEGAKYNVKRNDDLYTTYEIAVPWSALGMDGVKAGEVYGATIARVLADREYAEFVGWISWGTGILGQGNTKEYFLSGPNALRISNTPAVGGTTTAAPAGNAGTAAPATADAGMVAAMITMVASAGAVLSLKKRR